MNSKRFAAILSVLFMLLLVVFVIQGITSIREIAAQKATISNLNSQLAHAKDDSENWRGLADAIQKDLDKADAALASISSRDKAFLKRHPVNVAKMKWIKAPPENIFALVSKSQKGEDQVDLVITYPRKK